jgi:hypothetical protein
MSQPAAAFESDCVFSVLLLAVSRGLKVDVT